MSMDLSGFVQRKTPITIGTKKFTFTELTLGDLAEFRSEMQKKRNAFNTERRRRILEDAKTIGGIDPMKLLEFIDKPLTEDEIDAEMETTEGLAYLAYLSLHYSQPEMSKDDVLKIITPSVLPEITEALFTLPEGSKKKLTAAESK